MEKVPETNESMEKVEDLGVAIAVEGEVGVWSFRIVEDVKSRAKLVFAVGENTVSHITLFQGRFPEGTKLKIVEAINSLDLSKLGELEMEDELFFRPNGNIFWNIKKNETLKNFHELLNQKLFPMTHGLVMDQFKVMLEKPDLPEGDREQLMKYGVLLAGDKFLPHITLGRLSNPEDKEKLSGIYIPKISFSPKNIFIGNLGQYGEVRSV